MKQKSLTPFSNTVSEAYSEFSQTNEMELCENRDLL